MTKADIIKQIARETGVEAVTVSAVVEEFMEQVRVPHRSARKTFSCAASEPS